MTPILTSCLKTLGSDTKAPPRIGVLGDVILDRYLWGEVERISPEAPVPVLDFRKETTILGGAANVAANIRVLGPRVEILGLTGEDEDRSVLLQLLRDQGIETGSLMADPSRPTTTKTRVVAQNQQIVRIDREVRARISETLAEKLCQRIDDLLPDLDVIVVSDYGKGVVGPRVLDHLRKVARPAGLPVIVDPKNPDFTVYRGFSLLSPNNGEAAMGAGFRILNEDDLFRAGETLLSRFDLDSVLITRGAQGMSLFQKGQAPIHIPTRARNVFDVTGAGDTVVAVLSLGMAHGFRLEECAHLANYAAGVAVGKVGTATVTLSEIEAAIAYDDYSASESPARS